MALSLSYSKSLSYVNGVKRSRKMRFTLVKTQFPKNILNEIASVPVDRGIPAWVIPDQKLEGLIPEIIPWMSVPK